MTPISTRLGPYSYICISRLVNYINNFSLFKINFLAHCIKYKTKCFTLQSLICFVFDLSKSAVVYLRHILPKMPNIPNP